MKEMWPVCVLSAYCPAKLQQLREMGKPPALFYALTASVLRRIKGRGGLIFAHMVNNVSFSSNNVNGRSP